jgi:hypothetical protein
VGGRAGGRVGGWVGFAAAAGVCAYKQPALAQATAHTALPAPPRFPLSPHSYAPARPACRSPKMGSTCRLPPTTRRPATPPWCMCGQPLCATRATSSVSGSAGQGRLGWLVGCCFVCLWAQPRPGLPAAWVSTAWLVVFKAGQNAAGRIPTHFASCPAPRRPRRDHLHPLYRGTPPDRLQAGRARTAGKPGGIACPPAVCCPGTNRCLRGTASHPDRSTSVCFCADRLLRCSPPTCCPQVLDYDNVQQTLLPLLARAYSLVFMVGWSGVEGGREAGREGFLAGWLAGCPSSCLLGTSIAPAAARLPATCSPTCQPLTCPSSPLPACRAGR